MLWNENLSSCPVGGSDGMDMYNVPCSVSNRSHTFRFLVLEVSMKALKDMVWICEDLCQCCGLAVIDPQDRDVCFNQTKECRLLNL